MLKLALNIFSVSAKQGGVMRSGTADRYKDSAEDEADSIMRFCRERMAGAHYPINDFYPAVVNVVQLEAMGFSAQADEASRVGS